MATISTGVYGSFPTTSTLEDLMIQLILKAADEQRNPTLNPTELSYLTLSVDAVGKTLSASCIDYPVDTSTQAAPTAINHATDNGATFTTGTGSWPLNAPNLWQAILDVTRYYRRMEISLANNPERKEYLRWDIKDAESIGSDKPDLFSFDLTGIPINISSTGAITGKTYLV